MVQVPVPRIGTSDASRRSVDRRTDILRSVRDLTSGGDISSQLAAEVKSMTRAERESLLGKANLPITVSPDHALAIRQVLEFLGIN